MKRWIAGIVLVTLVAGALVFFLVVPGIVEKAQNGMVEHDPYTVSPQAQALHDSLVIADWHADTLLWNRDILERGDRGHVDLPRLAEGNVALQMFTTVTRSPAGQNYESNSADARDQLTPLVIGQAWPPRTWTNLTERGLYQAERLHDAAEAAPEALRIIRSKGDLAELLEARAGGAETIGALLGAEGGHVLEGDIANLARLYDAGFRMIGLTHFFDNALGGSLHGTSNAGLTDFGREVVAGMVERGMIIDLAHASPAMARDVLDMVDVPVVVSHTGIHSHCPSHRNFEDDLMRAIADRGGLIAIGYWADVTCDATPEGVASAIAAAVDLVGYGHVALGSDYDGAVTVAFDTSELAALTQALLDRGLSEEVIRAVMGGNTVRFLSQRLPD